MISSSDKVCETLHEDMVNEVSTSELDDKEDKNFIRNMENKKFKNIDENNDIDNGAFESNCEIGTYIPEGSDIEAPKVNVNNRPDSCSITSIASFSSVSSSSSLSSIGLSVESVKKANQLVNQNLNSEITNLENNNNNNNNNNNSNNNNNNNNNSDNFHPMVHQKIRRVPSTANPKYRVPNLHKNQRSKSQPYVNVNHLIHQQRRNSSPSNLSGRGIANKYTKTSSSLPNFSSLNQHQPQDSNTQPQQQIIYLQIPQPSQTQLSDPQALQQQISSQLQLLVPQIYNQLVNQIYSKSDNSGTVNMTINQNISKDGKDESVGKCSSKSNIITEKNLCQNSNDQQFQQAPSAHLQSQTFHESHISSGTKYVDEDKNREIIDFSQILQQFPLESLQKSRNSYIEIQRHPGTPKIIIPITEELILQCQQLQQYKESFMPYQPKLETILEESLSVKHLKISKFSKAKIVACVITILCVIVVVLLAKDKTIAVVVVASVFILFLVGSTFYLYTHSNKREIENSHSRAESARLQINDYAHRNSAQMV